MKIIVGVLVSNNYKCLIWIALVYQFFCVSITTMYIIYTFCFSNCCSIFDALKLVFLSFIMLILAFFNLELISTILNLCWHCFHTVCNMDHWVYLNEINETCVSLCISQVEFSIALFDLFWFIQALLRFLKCIIFMKEDSNLKFLSWKFKIEYFHKYYLGKQNIKMKHMSFMFPYINSAGMCQ